MRTSIDWQSAAGEVARQPGLFNLFFATLFEPRRAASHIRERSHLLAPIAVLAAGTAAILAWYYSRLDYAWFTDYLFATNPVLATYSDRSSLHLSRDMLLVPATLSSTVTLVAGWVAIGIYLYLAAKLARREETFPQWLALAAWSYVPHILVLPLALFVVWLHPDGRLAPDQLDPTTLGMLLDVPASSLWHPVAMRIGIGTVWQVAVLAIGFAAWTRLGVLVSTAIVAAPFAAVLGLSLLPGLLH